MVILNIDLLTYEKVETLLSLLKTDNNFMKDNYKISKDSIKITYELKKDFIILFDPTNSSIHIINYIIEYPAIFIEGSDYNTSTPSYHCSSSKGCFYYVDEEGTFKDYYLITIDDLEDLIKLKKKLYDLKEIDNLNTVYKGIHDYVKKHYLDTLTNIYLFLPKE